MSRTSLTAVALITLLLCGFTPQSVDAIDVVWDGGDGSWDDLKWNGGQDIASLVGEPDGADGWKSPLNEGEEENIFIGSGATVTYPADALSADFEMRQGSNLTIRDGATWQQVEDDTWSENRWTEMDLSNLVLDNGTFRRTGFVREEGGGALIFGSWQGDDTFSEPDSPLDHQEISISITNGGRLENEGQLWFGSWGDTPPNGTVISMTINNGTVDLTGGHVIMDPDFQDPPANADLVFSNKFLDDFDLPKYSVNFTGPGSITVDRSGIINASIDDFGDWQGLDPITYEALWDAGILQANGQSGPDGARFSDFFTVTGSLGSDNYTLTWKSIVGDFDGDGDRDINDVNSLIANITPGPPDPAKYDLTGDGQVNQADLTFWAKDPNAKNTWLGDSNLDGAFDTTDLVQIFQRGKFELDVAAGWDDGDWTGDARFGTSDLVAAFQDGGFELGPRAGGVNVPEPGTLACLSLGFVSALLLLRRHS